jgi:hypothetical protein
MNDQQLAAVKQALEALMVFRYAPPAQRPLVLKAITALQSIISQDALDKMAENARELGLDYEPAVQEKCFLCGERVDSCASDVCPKSTQPAVQEGRDWSLLAATQESLREHMAEIKRLKAAQNPWVNLTDEEMKDLWAIHSGPPLYRAIEAKLKEKNHA